MGEGRAMRLATRDFYARDHDGDTISTKKNRRAGPGNRRSIDQDPRASLAHYDYVLGTTGRGSEREAHGENGTPKHGQDISAITWVKYRENSRSKNFRNLDPNGRVQSNDGGFY